MGHPLPKKDLEHVFAHTRPLWDQFRGGTIFVGGATGSFEIWLLESFAFANKSLDLWAKLGGLLRNLSAFSANVSHVAQESSIALYRGYVTDFDFPLASLTHNIHEGTISSSPPLPSKMLILWAQ
jgi:hypothetical protein